MNCTAMIEEVDATKFLYRYNNTPLETIIDTDIKKMVEDQFNMETAKYTSTDLLKNKETIMNTVKANVVSYFKDFGITITVLGLKEGISYENPAIQAAIDEKYASEQQVVIQENLNKANLAKAEAEANAAKIAANAEAEVKKILAEAEANANKKIAESLTDEVLAKIYYDKWDGKLPTVTGGGDYILPSDFLG